MTTLKCIMITCVGTGGNVLEDALSIDGLPWDVNLGNVLKLDTLKLQVQLSMVRGDYRTSRKLFLV